jgi:hypothetical protein
MPEKRDEGMRISTYPHDGMAAMGYSDCQGDDNK